jgi:6-phosphofructo-2-kinase/fructose-2,6-biphosphatase 2
LKLEQYNDLFLRLRPLVMQVESSGAPILIVAHKAVMRCLFGYFLGVQWEDIPDMPVPCHTVQVFTPVASGFQVETYKMNIDHIENES